MAIFAHKIPRLVDTGTAAANTAVVRNVVAPAADRCYYIFGIIAGYSSASAVGTLTIESGNPLVTRMVIPIHGVGSFLFPEPLPMGAGNAFRLTLSAAGSSVIGRINAWGDTSIPPDPIG